MTYGKDYGIKVEVPWYINCPIVNWFFDTCKVEITLTTFDEDGGPMLGISGRFRVPFKDKGNYINSVIKTKYCFPNDHFDLGYGLWVNIDLLDVNHRKVYDSHLIHDDYLSTGYAAKPKKCLIWFMNWKRELVDATFNKKDFTERKKGR